MSCFGMADGLRGFAGQLSAKENGMTRRRLAGTLRVVGLLSGLLCAVPAQAQQIHRNGFETQKMGWLKGGFDAPYEEKTHNISDQVGHESRHSEYLQFDAKQGA